MKLIRKKNTISWQDTWESQKPKKRGADHGYTENAGPSVVPFDDVMKYPRICAHRGFNTVAPKNCMPAFCAAIALGAEEIEFDLWSIDGVLVSCHDSTLNRVSNGTGNIKIFRNGYRYNLNKRFFNHLQCIKR